MGHLLHLKPNLELPFHIHQPLRTAKAWKVLLNPPKHHVMIHINVLSSYLYDREQQDLCFLADGKPVTTLLLSFISNFHLMITHLQLILVFSNFFTLATLAVIFENPFVDMLPVPMSIKIFILVNFR